MNRSERFIADRAWLKIRRFAITGSLKSKLGESAGFTDREREFICYIQNKILRETRKCPAYWANVGAKYWEDKCGGNYRRWIDVLIGWGELEVNTDERTGKERYSTGTGTGDGWPKSYRVPFSARASGVTKIDFRHRANRTKDRTDLKTADDIIRHVHKCCSLLTVPKTLVDILDPISDSAAHEFSRRVYWGDFNIRYGDKGGRLFHSVIEMPRKARANLEWKKGGSPLFEYDIKSCHPVLLLTLFSDPLERERYSVLLDNDIYTTIRDVMGVPEDRDGVKIEFMVCTNSTDRYVAEKRGFVYQFFKTQFPIFTREILDLRSDLAAYLQQRESEIMVQQLGRLCSERDIFWISCHDGWMGIEAGEVEIIRAVAESFHRVTGYPVRIEKTELGTGLCTTVFGMGGGYGSYVRIEPTFSTSDYRKSALEWFANLPKHPEPDASTLKKRREARENRQLGLRGHRRRLAESERLGKKARPLWRRLMGEGEVA